jgi:hypothetical protein
MRQKWQAAGVRILPAQIRPTPRPPGRERRLTQAKDIVATAHGEATVLLDVERGRYHLLNAVGGSIWGLLATGMSREAIVRAIEAEYDIPAESAPGQVERDVDVLLKQLWAQGLLEEVA